MSDTTTTQPEPVAAPEPSRADKLRGAARDALRLPAKGAVVKAASPPAAAKVEAIEAKGEAPPEQKAGETDQRYEQRLAETLRKLSKVEGDAITHRKRGDDLEREWKPIKDVIAAAKGDPERLHDLLELAGYTPDQVAQLMIDKKITRRVPKASLPPEVQARIDTLEAAAAKLKEREDAEAEQGARAGDMQAINAGIEQAGEALPYLRSLPGSADRIYSALRAQFDRTGETPDLAAELKRANEAIESDLKAVMTEHTIKTLATDGKIRATIVAALGLTSVPSTANPASERKGKSILDGPKTLSLNVTSEVPARSDKPPTKAERDQRVKQAARGVLGLK